MENNNIEEIISSIEEFNRQTTRFQKDFKKLSKKLKGADDNFAKKQISKFTNDNLYPFWARIVEPSFGEKKLSKEVALVYIAGVFITGHSRAFDNNQREVFKNVAIEILERLND
jgi:hypothetical protein